MYKLITFHDVPCSFAGTRARTECIRDGRTHRLRAVTVKRIFAGFARRGATLRRAAGGLLKHHIPRSVDT